MLVLMDGHFDGFISKYTWGSDLLFCGGRGDKSDVDTTSASALWDCPTQEMFFNTKEQYREPLWLFRYDLESKTIIIESLGWQPNPKTESKCYVWLLQSCAVYHLWLLT